MKFALLIAAVAAQDKIADKLCDTSAYATDAATAEVTAATADAAKCGAACGTAVDAITTKAENDYCCHYVAAVTGDSPVDASCALVSRAKADPWATAVKDGVKDKDCAWEWAAGVAVAAEKKEEANTTNDSDSAKIMTASFLATTATLAMVY